MITSVTKMLTHKCRFPPGPGSLRKPAMRKPVCFNEYKNGSWVITSYCLYIFGKIHLSISTTYCILCLCISTYKLQPILISEHSLGNCYLVHTWPAGVVIHDVPTCFLPKGNLNNYEHVTIM